MDILQRINAGKKGISSDYDEDVFIDIHHVLIKEYGWIPFNELFGEKKEQEIKYEIPIITHKSRGKWYLDFFYGKIEEIQMIKCTGKIVKDKLGLPNPTLWNLMKCIERDREQERKNYEKAKAKR